MDPGRSVSKTHLQMGVDADGAWVADRGSTNGTVVTLPDGQQVVCRVDHPVRLRPGATVQLGDCTLRRPGGRTGVRVLESGHGRRPPGCADAAGRDRGHPDRDRSVARARRPALAGPGRCSGGRRGPAAAPLVARGGAGRRRPGGDGGGRHRPRPGARGPHRGDAGPAASPSTRRRPRCGRSPGRRCPGPCSRRTARSSSSPRASTSGRSRRTTPRPVRCGGRPRSHPPPVRASRRPP